MQWEDEKCLRLIELYKLKPEIWQTTHKFYHNTDKKQEAWSEITKDMGSKVDVVKSKISSLLNTFRRERIKEATWMGTTKNQTGVYANNWFAYDAFAFLRDNQQCRKTRSTAPKKNYFHEIVATEDITDEHTEREIPTRDDDSDYSNDSDDSEDTRESLSSVTVQNTSEETTADINSQRTAAKRRPTFKQPNEKKRKLETQSDPLIDKASDVLQTRDGCAVYGEHIAIKLRSYSKRTQSVVQHLFNDILFNADMGQYDVNIDHKFYRQQYTNNNYNHATSNDTSCSTSRTSNSRTS